VGPTNTQGIGKTKTLMEKLPLVEEIPGAFIKIMKIFLLLVIIR
jgi:hypothetical protein